MKKPQFNVHMMFVLCGLVLFLQLLLRAKMPIVVSIGGFGVCMAFFIYEYRRNAPRFPAMDDRSIRFSERFVSGRSHMSWITWLGGASNAISITVTMDELWISSHWLFRPFSWFYDLEHRVPLENLTDLAQNRAAVTLTFLDAHSEQHRLTLRLRNTDHFVGQQLDGSTQEN